MLWCSVFKPNTDLPQPSSLVLTSDPEKVFLIISKITGFLWCWWGQNGNRSVKSPPEGRRGSSSSTITRQIISDAVVVREVNLWAFLLLQVFYLEEILKMCHWLLESMLSWDTLESSAWFNVSTWLALNRKNKERRWIKVCVKMWKQKQDKRGSLYIYPRSL